jgi:protein-disulfide isomerase
MIYYYVMSKRFLLVLAIIVLGLGGVFWLTRDKANAPSSGNAQATNHLRSHGNSGVVLLEYGDLQCPACGAYYPIIKQLETKYASKVTFQFRHFPLVQLHPNAFAAARAAEAAGLQGKFFEMHDKLYENQQSWSGSSNPNIFFEDYATQLGLKLDQFRKDSASSLVNDIINADIKAGQAAGADATPTFVLDGKKLDQNPPDYTSFAKLLDDAIKAKTGQ